MSSNNQLIILKKGKDFCVFHKLCIDNPFYPSKASLLKKEKTLINAIKYANNYCREYSYVEYGIHIDDSCLED